MRITKAGKRYVQDLNAQDFLVQTVGQREAWLSLTRQYLGDVELMAARCGVADQMPVTTIKAALKLLIEYLERNR